MDTQLVFPEDHGEKLSDPINDKDVWHPADTYFSTFGLIYNQIGSYNRFIFSHAQQVIDGNPTVDIIASEDRKTRVEFGELVFTYPQNIEVIHPLSIFFGDS